MDYRIQINAKGILTHLSQMNFPISISKTSLFQILGLLGGIFIFIQRGS